MAKKSEKKHPSRQKPPPLDQYIKPIVALGIAMLAYQFFKGVNSEVSRSAARFKLTRFLLTNVVLFPRLSGLMYPMKWHCGRYCLVN